MIIAWHKIPIKTTFMDVVKQVSSLNPHLKGKNDRLVVSQRSLKDYMSNASSRKSLSDALTPRAREIRLTRVSNCEELALEISTLMYLMKNAIEQQSEPLSIILGSPARQNGQRMPFPFYGFDKVTGCQSARTSVLICVLKSVLTKLILKESCTIRDVFYSNVELYKNQNVVTGWLNSIAVALELPHRDMLNVVAAQKGLCYSPIDLEYEDIRILKNHKSLVPLVTAANEFTGDWSKIERLVVLEKDAVFNTVVEDLSVSSKCVLVTAKGYPDWGTRHFLYKLMLSCPPSVAFEIYTDSDPYGVDIALKYIYSNEKKTYQCPRLVYRGVLIRDTLTKNKYTSDIQLLNLSFRDFKFAINLLTKLVDMSLPDVNNNKPTMILELQRQLFYHKKAEMNTVSGSNFGNYISQKNKSGRAGN